MEIIGIVTTGLGKAAYFLGQDFYKNQFREKCGFTPFPGTLNIIVEEDKLEDIRLMKSSCKNLIKPDQGFGAVRYIVYSSSFKQGHRRSYCISRQDNS